MTNKELQEKLREIKRGMKLFDTIVDTVDAEMNSKDVDEPDTVSISLSQARHVQKMFDLFRSLNWQVSLNNHTEIKHGDNPPVRKSLFGGKTGDLVKIRPVGEKYEGNTYLGIFIGELSQEVSCSIDKDNVLKVDFGTYNPGILVPELGEIIYGYESWWGVIESEEELDNLITDETISNLWYVKVLKGLYSEK